MRRVYKRAEKKICTVIKLLFWIVFYIIFGIAGLKGDLDIVNFCNMMFLIWPCISIAYSFLLMKFQFLSVPLPNQENEQYLRFENLIN